jgi:flagellar L-ring protein FlgH
MGSQKEEVKGKKTGIGAAVCFIFAASTFASSAAGQSSSMMRVQPQRPGDLTAMGAVAPGATGGAPFQAVPPRELARASTRAIEATSMIAVPQAPPRKFKVEDLVSIIVRQQKKYEADGKLDNKKKWDTSGRLSEWFRFYEEHRLGSSTLRHGEPGFKFNLDNKYKAESSSDREDRFTTRIQARIIDVKPNGTLVLEARLEQTHDEERFTVTLTGVCRSEDVTPDNSILSTQIADLVLVERNQGAVRQGTRRGWVPRLLDMGGVF